MRKCFVWTRIFSLENGEKRLDFQTTRDTCGRGQQSLREYVLQFGIWQLTHYKSAYSFNTQFHSKIKPHLSVLRLCGRLKRYGLLLLNKYGNPLSSSNDSQRLKFWNKTPNKADENGQTLSHRSDEKKLASSILIFTNLKLVTPFSLENILCSIFHEAERISFQRKNNPRCVKLQIQKSLRECLVVIFLWKP